MRIGLDIDNVISNFNEGLLEEFLKKDKEFGNKGIVNKNAEYITKGMFSWDQEEVKKFFADNIERIAENLEVKEGVKESIDKLKEEGHEIYIISARDNGHYTDPFTMTKNWLDKNLISYDKLILTNDYYVDKYNKANKCLEYDIDIMLDDSPTICSRCIEKGIHTILMDTSYNKYSNLKRVYNFKEFYEYVQNMKREKINVILDTDTYNECDDQFALAYMLKSQDRFNVEAITVAPYSHQSKNISVPEGQELSYNEILKISKWLNFDDSNKVFKGSMDYMVNNYQESSDAVNKIIEIALKNEKTYIMAIGALTNIGLAIKKEPKIIDKIEIVWLGGHSFLQRDNIEFNFRQDIEAVREVFESKVALTVIPCKNVASNLRTSIYDLNHHLKDKSEVCNYLIDRFYNDGYHGLQENRVIWDISVIAYLINKNWFSVDEISCPIINDDMTYTKTVDKHKVKFVNYLDANMIYKDLFEKLDGTR